MISTGPDTQNLSPRKKAFLTAFSRSGVVSAAAEAAGIDRRTHYDWMANDPEYPAHFERAKDAAGDYLETVAVQRATEGRRTYKFDAHGKPVMWDNPFTGKREHYHETKTSDTMLIVLLKMRGRFVDRLGINGHMQHDVNVQLSDDDRGTAERIAQRRLALAPN